MSRIVRSIVWLVGCTALGYGLLVTITPTGDTIKEKHPELRNPEVKKRTQEFLNALEFAANTNKPLYRRNKEDLEKELKKSE